MLKYTVLKDVFYVEAKTLVGRFAPTPSGFLHLGNIFCSLLCWLYIKSRGGRIILRIEDLDAMRCPHEKADALARDMEWFGLTWDSGAYAGADSEAYFQSNRFHIYKRYFDELNEKGLLFPCFCSRNELHAAEAPHLSDGRVVYPGTCRNLTDAERRAKALKRPPAWRVKTEDRVITFTDGHYGKESYNLARESGDFIVRRSDGIYAYQLAVTIDDALMGVTHVIRGADLLSSTAMQLYLYGLFGFTPPAFTHIPLLTAADGRRLAKRDGDLEVRVLRDAYGSPEPIIGMLAYLAGQLDKPEPITAEALLPIFRPEKIPRENIIVPREMLKV